MFNWILKIILKKKNELIEKGEDKGTKYEDLTLMEAHLRKLKEVTLAERAKAGDKVTPMPTKKQQPAGKRVEEVSFKSAKRSNFAGK